MAFVQAAVYDAVVGIEGRYAPYRFHAHAPRGASAQAAAVAAAHEILVTYVPSAQATLDADYAASLAQLPDGTAKTRGIAFGTRAADNLIRLRAHDGRNAPIFFTQPPAPGVWRPTPPAFLPMVGAVARLRDAAAGAQRHPVRPAGAARAHLGPLHPRLQRGQGPGFAHLDRADGGADEHRDCSSPATPLVQFNAALRDQVTRAAPGHRRRRPDVRRHRHERRGRGNHRVAREVRLRLLAADHRDQPGRHRRQPGHGPRSQLGAAVHYTQLPRVPQRVQRVQLDRESTACRTCSRPGTCT